MIESFQTDDLSRTVAPFTQQCKILWIIKWQLQ